MSAIYKFTDVQDAMSKNQNGLYFVCADGGVLSPAAITEMENEVRENTDCKPEDLGGSEYLQWRVIACEYHTGKYPMYCDHTGQRIYSVRSVPELG